jgi:hypothetical protein
MIDQIHPRPAVGQVQIGAGRVTGDAEIVEDLLHDTERRW